MLNLMRNSDNDLYLFVIFIYNFFLNIFINYNLIKKYILNHSSNFAPFFVTILLCGLSK